eukprot:TRINITY_DN4372_c0_g2_i1.p1 TRINITY_DN4372_c0_g2~~TRINITY_DN4372_c0_g2_i1.p1  ORF type:complete len:434 (-),score=42.96 TRINITY_DN4372_c0_g2_i1:27-1328(-)
MYYVNPLSGIVRIAFYGGLYLYCNRRPLSPLKVSEDLPLYDRRLIHEKGLTELIVPLVSDDIAVLINALLHISWICCIIGFGGHFPVILNSLSFFVIYAILSGMNGPNHKYHAACFALIGLSLSNANHELSVDSALGIFQYEENSILRSNIGTSLAMMLVVYTLYGGAISKLTNTGIKWMDGYSLQFFLKAASANGRQTFMNRIVSNSVFLCSILSIASIIMELFAPVVLLTENHWLRLFFVISFWGFHLGIYLTMYPEYVPQSLCYLMLLGKYELVYQYSTFEYVGMYLVSVMLLVLPFTKIETWPLSSIPMYSYYRKGFSTDSVNSEQIETMKRELRQTNTVWYHTTWLKIELKDGTDILPIIRQMHKRRQIQLDVSQLKDCLIPVYFSQDETRRKEISQSLADICNKYYKSSHLTPNDIIIELHRTRRTR